MPGQVSYFDLGASLYTPCTHTNLPHVLQVGVPLVRSLIVCLEDSVKEYELSSALNNLKKALGILTPSSAIKRFIRVRNPLVLAEIMSYEHIGKIDGFVLPKFDLHNIDLYKKVIQEQAHSHFSFMPVLETAQVFDPQAMSLLCKQLQNWGDKVVCLRIGGNDLMNLLGIKRMQGMTTYDTPLRSVIDQLVMQFRPQGFELSAPVFDMIEDTQTLRKEVTMDLVYGFFAKTAIHPSQIEIIESAFSEFSETHVDQARHVLNESSAAVFKFNGQMMEQSCHRSWATRTVNLAERYN